MEREVFRADHKTIVTYDKANKNTLVMFHLINNLDSHLLKILFTQSSRAFVDAFEIKASGAIPLNP